jgi:hypothetical protein
MRLIICIPRISIGGIKVHSINSFRYLDGMILIATSVDNLKALIGIEVGGKVK